MIDPTRQEIEVKYAVSHHADIRQRILGLGGRLLHDRHLERNWRFDTPDRSLTSEQRVLRIRQGDRATVTYKGPRSTPTVRTEIEFEVDDTQAASELLQALDYQVMQVYEKYREIFGLDDVEVMLDELPFGSFVEIEAESLGGLQTTSAQLGLMWERRVSQSYLEIFERVRERLGQSLKQATFEAFRQAPTVTPFDLGYADALDFGGESTTANDG
ncbi:MAG: class IV adenylate cyclase [Anaerolineales bacterium]